VNTTKDEDSLSLSLSLRQQGAISFLFGIQGQSHFASIALERYSRSEITSQRAIIVVTNTESRATQGKPSLSLCTAMLQFPVKKGGRIR